MQPQAGFTLIELLVALAILAAGLTAGIGLLRPDPRQPLNTEIERLALLLEQAHEEGELTGAPVAWLALPDGYAFERLSPGVAGVQWQPMGDDALLRPRQFPAGFTWLHRQADDTPVDIGHRVRLDEQGIQRLELDLGYGEAHGTLRFAQGLAHVLPATMAVRP